MKINKFVIGGVVILGAVVLLIWNATTSIPKLGIASLTLSLIGFMLYFIPFIVGYIVGIRGVSATIERLEPVYVVGWLVSWCGNFLGLWR